MTDQEVAVMVEYTIDKMLKDIQDKMGVKTGDVAGVFFTGSNNLCDLKLKVVKLMLQYVALERLYLKDDAP